MTLPTDGGISDSARVFRDLANKEGVSDSAKGVLKDLEKSTEHLATLLSSKDIDKSQVLTAICNITSSWRMLARGGSHEIGTDTSRAQLLLAYGKVIDLTRLAVTQKQTEQKQRDYDNQSWAAWTFSMAAQGVRAATNAAAALTARALPQSYLDFMSGVKDKTDVVGNWLSYFSKTSSNEVTYEDILDGLAGIQKFLEEAHTNVQTDTGTVGDIRKQYGEKVEQEPQSEAEQRGELPIAAEVKITLDNANKELEMPATEFQEVLEQEAAELAAAASPPEQTEETPRPASGKFNDLPEAFRTIFENAQEVHAAHQDIVEELQQEQEAIGSLGSAFESGQAAAAAAAGVVAEAVIGTAFAVADAGVSAVVAVSNTAATVASAAAGAVSAAGTSIFGAFKSAAVGVAAIAAKKVNTRLAEKLNQKMGPPKLETKIGTEKYEKLTAERRFPFMTKKTEMALRTKLLAITDGEKGELLGKGVVTAFVEARAKVTSLADKPPPENFLEQFDSSEPPKSYKEIRKMKLKELAKSIADFGVPNDMAEQAASGASKVMRSVKLKVMERALRYAFQHTRLLGKLQIKTKLNDESFQISPEDSKFSLRRFKRPAEASAQFRELTLLTMMNDVVKLMNQVSEFDENPSQDKKVIDDKYQESLKKIPEAFGVNGVLGFFMGSAVGSLANQFGNSTDFDLMVPVRQGVIDPWREWLKVPEEDSQSTETQNPAAAGQAGSEHVKLDEYKVKVAELLASEELSDPDERKAFLTELVNTNEFLEVDVNSLNLSDKDLQIISQIKKEKNSRNE